MSEIMRDRLSNSIGKVAKIFLVNGFRYEGELTNCDEKYVEILDFKTNSYKVILLIEIKDVEVAADDTH